MKESIVINRKAHTRHSRRANPHGEPAALLLDRLSPRPVTRPVRTDTVELPRLIATAAVTA